VTQQMAKAAPETTAPEITAVICTTGARDCLAAATASLAEQTLERDLYEVVVVLNHPAPGAFAAFQDSLEVFRSPDAPCQIVLLQEPVPGLSQARNTGLRAARGRYVAYLDDDAVADPKWLELIVAAFRRDPEVASVGGDIHPLWEADKPRWITRPMYAYFSCVKYGQAEKYMPTGSYFFGANMAFTKEVLDACGGFPTNLGRKKNNLLSNEEWPVFEFIDARGLKKWYSPAISVKHLVHRSRMTAVFFARRLWWQGISNTVHSLECKGTPPGEVAAQSWRSFRDYYRRAPAMLKHGHTSVPLLFFNLFRWAGIYFHLTKHWLGHARRQRG